MNGLVSRCRPAAYLVVFFYCWSGLGIFNLVQAMDRAVPAPEPANHWEELSALAGQARDLVSGAQARLDRKQSAAPMVGALSNLAEKVRAVDEKLRQGFADTDAWLAMKNADPELFLRNGKAAQAHETKMEAFYSGVKAVSDAATNPEALAASIRDLKKAMEPTPRPESPLPFDPDLLPHRAVKFKSPEPSLGGTKPGEPKKKGVLVADLSFMPILTQGLVGLTDTPEAADLAETVEVKFTAEIQALAASLNHDPVKIYEYVRNNVAFEPTYGSIKGAAQCLWEKSGNDFDQASLLIALLRASNVPARYEYGTVEIPVAQVNAWLGSPTAEASQSLLSSGGIPTVGITSGGDVIAMRIEHVWVRAYLDYTPSRGGVFVSGDRWVRLDPSFKQYENTPGVDWNNQFNLAPQALWDQTNAASVQGDNFATSVPSTYLTNKVAEVKGELNDYLVTHPVTTQRELIGAKKVIKKAYGILPCTMLYEVKSLLAEYTEVPDAKRHKVTFSVQRQDEIIPGWPEWVQDWSFSTSLPEIAGKPVTLSYAGDAATENYLTNLVPARLAGETDEQYLARWPTNLNCTFMRVKPELKVDGETKASGTFVDFGYDQVFTMNFTSPGGYNNDTVENEITAGSYQALVMNLGVISGDFCTARETRARAVYAQLQAGNTDGITRDNFFGELLFAAGLKYWGQNNFNDGISAGSNGVQTTRLPSEGLFSYNLTVTWTTDWFGNTTPSTATPAGLGTDVDMDVAVVAPGDGDAEKTKNYMLASGMAGSMMESAVFDQLMVPTEELSNTGISAAHALMKANQNGTPVYGLTSENVNDVLPLLTVSADVKAAVSAAVAAGKTVVIPRDPVLLDGWWTGAGYVVADPATGAGAYMISGGAAGGEKKWPTLNPFVLFTVGAVLTLAGIFASTLPGVGLAIMGLLVSCYDLLTTLSEFLDNPDVDDQTKETIKEALIFFTLIGAFLTIAGIFLGGVGAFLAITMLYLVLSILVGTLLTTIAPILSKHKQDIENATNQSSILPRIREWMAKVGRWAEPRFHIDRTPGLSVIGVPA